MFRNDTNSAAGRPLLIPPVDAAPPGYFETNDVRMLAVTPMCPPAMLQSSGGGSFRMEDFQVWKTLGEGYASVVYHGFCKRSRVPVAIKAYKKVRLSRLNDFQVRREVAIHSRLRHPNIIDLYVAFEDSRAYYLIQELAAKGDLFVRVRSRSMQLSEKEVVGIMLPVMEALQYLHEQGIIHRDIKPENIFISHNNEPKLGDLGLAINHLDERPVTRLGTLDYMAPEILLCHTKEKPTDYKDDPVATYASNVDCWAMGVLAYELLTGRPPFRGESRQAISQAIMSTQPQYAVWLSSAAVEFMSKALLKSSAKRPSMLHLIRHPWITTYVGRDAFCRYHNIPEAKLTASQEELTVKPTHSLSFSMGAQSVVAYGQGSDPNMLEAHRRANPGRPTAALQPGAPGVSFTNQGAQSQKAAVGQVEVSSKSFAPGTRPVLAASSNLGSSSAARGAPSSNQARTGSGASRPMPGMQPDLRTESYTAGARLGPLAHPTLGRVQVVGMGGASSRLANMTRSNNGAMAAMAAIHEDEGTDSPDKPKKLGLMSRLKNAMTRKKKEEDISTGLEADMQAVTLGSRMGTPTNPPPARSAQHHMVQGSAKSYSVGKHR